MHTVTKMSNLRHNILIVLLEYIDFLSVLLGYIDLFNLSGNIKQTFGRGALPFTTLCCYVSF